jgi:membrane protease YdiL (CAAX protease family)
VLCLRPLLERLGSDPNAILLTVFVALLAVGSCWPVPGTAAPTGGPRWRRRMLVLCVGILAFAAARLLGGAAPESLNAQWVALNSLAALAEEAFFRRVVYGWLRPGGPALAVAGSAVLFGLAHVTVYGWWVLPVDLAAGGVLAWQRWAGDSWLVSGLTHVIANVLVVT